MIDIIYRYDPATAGPPGPPATPAEARERLCAGNREFISLAELAPDGSTATRIIPIDLRELGVSTEVGTAPRQQPFAAVLGCADARVPTELVFGQACNALFVVRVAGNVLGEECLGSLEYAVRHLGENLQLLLVLGHSGCGAVTAAVDAFLDPARYLTVACSLALRSVVDRLLVSVRAAADALERTHGGAITRAPGYRAALLEVSVALNAALMAWMLEHEVRALGKMRAQVVFGVYQLVSRAVNLPGNPAEANVTRLFDPPETEEDFRLLGSRLASCPDVLRLLALV